LAGLWLLVGLAVIGRAQTQEALQVYVNQVGDVPPDDPQVMMTMTVIGPDRLPLESLSQVRIREMDGTIIDPNEVVPMGDGPLRLVLAFDLSYDSDSDWRDAVQAAQTLLDSLRPGDELSIIRFDSTMEAEVIELDPPTSLTLAVDDRFARGDNRTAFYQAVLAAVKQLTEPAPDPVWQGRQAVIVVTNIGDNTGTLESEMARQTISRTQLITAPVHIFSFSKKAEDNKKQFDEIVLATGGPQPIHVEEAAELSQPLADRIAGLRRQHQLTFDPHYQPGVVQHPVTVEVEDTEGRLITATTVYTFNAREPDIKLFGPKRAYLSHLVEFTAAVTMPFPVTEVTYQTPGQEDKSIGTPPYQFRWTANLTGTVTITAEARDRKNNIARKVITLTVDRLPAPVVQVSLPFNRTLHLSIVADNTATIDRIEIEWDNRQVITSLTESPFDFWLRPGDPGYPTEWGPQTFHVRIFDATNQLIREETIKVDFIRPASIPAWVWTALFSGLLLLINFIVLPFVLAAWYDNYQAELLSRREVRKFWLKNRGNVPARFVIEVMATVSGTLSFSLRQRLATGPATEPVQADQPMRTSPPQTKQPLEQPTAPASQPGRPANLGGLGQAGQRVGQLAGGGSAAMTAAGQLHSLPVLGPIMSRWAQAVRQRQTQGRGWLFGFTRLRRLASLFGSDAPAPETTEARSEDQEPPPEKTVPSQTRPASAPPASAPPAAASPRVLETGWRERPQLETGLIGPGKTLYFHLELQPARLDKRQTNLGFEIESRPLDAQDGSKPQRLKGSVPFGPRAWIYRDFYRLASLLILGIIAVDIVWVYYLVSRYLS
jgi:hypothetical protein